MLRGWPIRSDIVELTMAKRTRLNGSCTNTPAWREGQNSKAAECGQEHEASIKDEHDYENCVARGEIVPIK